MSPVWGVVIVTILGEKVRIPCVPEGANFVKDTDLSSTLVKGSGMGPMGNEGRGFGAIRKGEEGFKVRVGARCTKMRKIRPESRTSPGVPP